MQQDKIPFTFLTKSFLKVKKKRRTVFDDEIDDDDQNTKNIRKKEK